MHPTFSVIFLTTLLGVGQGMFLALFSGQVYSSVNLLPAQDSVSFYALGSLIALGFMIGGLIAAVGHLGKPSYMFTRAWRGVTQWRTSWLSRELILMPLMMLITFVYGVLHFAELDVRFIGEQIPSQLTLGIGIFGAIVCFTLFISTGMIYASIKFLQEWACSLTVINYILFGGASGFTLAAGFAAYQAPGMVGFYATWAIILTVVALFTRGLSLWRNARIKRKSTVQTAIGIRHTKVNQKSMGMMGGSYNTREYFHGKTKAFLKSVKWLFLILVFPVPVILVWAGFDGSIGLLMSAFVIQYVGLLFERWFFFAQANHPQNIYYQTV